MRKAWEKDNASKSRRRRPGKKKALDQDYKNAFKNIPEVKEKPNPWKTMR